MREKKSLSLYGIIAFLMGAFSMLSMLYLSGRIFKNEFILLSGDALKNVSNIRMISRNILNGENIWYSFSTSLGMNTSLIISYDFMSPFNLLYILFYNVDANLLTACIYILKTGIISSSFFLFATKGLKVNEKYALAFSCLYSMCSFGIYHGLMNNMWADALYLLPLVFLAIILAIEYDTFLMLILLYASAFVINFYTGYIIGVFSFIFFFFYLFLLCKQKDKKVFLFKIFKYIFSVLISILISSIVWMPTLYCILHYSGSDSKEFARINISFFSFVCQLLWGQSDLDAYRPFIFCGTINLVLLPLFLLNKNIEFRKKVLYIAVLFSCLLCFFVLPFYILIHGFDAPIGFDFRFSFVFSFILCSIGCNSINEIDICSNKKIIITSLVVLICSIIFEFFFGYKYSYIDFILILIVNSTLLVVWLAILLILKSNKKSIGYWAISAIVVLEVISNGYMQWSKLDSISKKTYDVWTYYMESMVSEQNDKDFYRIAYKNDFLDNSDSFWGYNGISDFGSADIPNLRITLQKLGLYTSTHMVHSTGINPVIEMILGVKYIYEGDNPYDVLSYPTNIKKYNLENDVYVGAGFMVPSRFVELDLLQTNSFENINDVMESLNCENSVFVPINVDNISIQENGLKISNYGDDYVFERLSDDDFASIAFLIDDSNDRDKYIQIVYEYPGYYNDIYFLMDGMSNLMIRETDLGDQRITGSPTVLMEKNEDGSYAIVSSFDPDDLQMPFKEICFYEFDRLAFEKTREKLLDEVFVVDEYKNGYVRGHVSVNGDNRNLFISIPYIVGWEAYVNGEKKEIYPALNDSFISIELPDIGDYDIELKYKCPYLNLGLGGSIFGLFLYAIFVVFFKEFNQIKKLIKI